MIYKSAIHRELNTNSFTVFIIILSISLSVISVRVLDHAATGEIDNLQVIAFLALSMIAAMPFILQATILVSILQTFQRYYVDSEMVIWESSKMPLFRWIWVIVRLVTFITIINAILIFNLRPWTFDIQTKLELQFQSKQKWFNASRGTFHNFANNTGTLYVEEDLVKNQKLKHLFLYKKNPDLVNQKGSFNLILAREGITTGLQNSSIVFLDGIFYEFINKPEKILLIEFARLNLASITPYQPASKDFDSMSSIELFKIKNTKATAELFWRSSVVLQTPVMALFSLGLAFCLPRKRNNLASIMIIAIALIYYNLINLAIPLVARENYNPWILFIFLHGFFTFVALIIIYLRTYRINLFTGFMRLLKTS